MKALAEIQRPAPKMSSAFNLRLPQSDKLAAEEAADVAGVTLSELTRAALRAAVCEITDLAADK